MGAEHSSESMKQKDEQYQRMLKNALEQQRKTYEEKCKELLRAQQKIDLRKKINESTEKQQMVVNALEKQRKMYEEKYNKLMEEQRMHASCFEAMHEAHNNRYVQQNPTLSVETQRNYAPLYPSLPQVPAVEMQPSTSNATYHAHSSNTAIFCQPSAPTAPTAPEASSTTHQNKNCQPSAPTAPTAPEASSTTHQNKNCQPSAPTALTAPEASSTTHQNKKVYKPKNKANKNVYKCPTCNLHINAKTNMLYQCQNGHTSCIKCKENVLHCGICKSTITNTRNIELESLTENLLKNNVQVAEKVQCPNKSDGCLLSFKPENLQGHLKECIFREMECPLVSAKYSECSWHGKINQMQAHFLECHPQQTGVNVDTEACFDLAINHYSILHTAMGNFNFMVHVKMDENLQTLFMTIQLIGSRVSASKWTYEFHVYEKAEPRRKFTYVDACLPTTVPFSDVANTAQCAALPLQYAMTFFKGNKFTYKFYIKRDESIARYNQRRNNKQSSVQLEQ